MGYYNSMKKETVREYTILYQYLLHLKEPTYIFLIQVFQHLSPRMWWEEYIEPVLQHENKENFKYLDMSDLLNVFKMNWENIFRYLDNHYSKYKYDKEYKLVCKIHNIRTVVAHANDIDMSPFILVDYLSGLLEYSKLIRADASLTLKLEAEWMKQQRELPEKKSKPHNDDNLRLELLTIIENKVLLKAVSCETLPRDIKLSIDRTIQRLHSMRTIEEIIGFFNGALQSERGLKVQKALNDNKLFGFDDIKDEINLVYKSSTE